MLHNVEFNKFEIFNQTLRRRSNIGKYLTELIAFIYFNISYAGYTDIYKTLWSHTNIYSACQSYHCGSVSLNYFA